MTEPPTGPHSFFSTQPQLPKVRPVPFFTPRYAKSKMGKKKKIGGGLRKKITIFQFWSFLSPKRLDGVYVLIDFRSFRVVLGIMARSQLFFGVLEQFTLKEIQFYKKITK